jgi:hypothetical protein
MHVAQENAIVDRYFYVPNSIKMIALAARDNFGPNALEIPSVELVPTNLRLDSSGALLQEEGRLLSPNDLELLNDRYLYLNV